ncbi:MAG: TolC family protein [Gammaproteobacteria bacterium]|nr:TolC family protein [Gammaproteobacteria bacterium]
MQKLSSKFAFLLLLLWWQVAPAEDLATVYGLALKNDAELKIAESNYLAAVQALPLASSQRKPQISFDANGSRRESAST